MPEPPVEAQAPATTPKDFATESKSNMWDSIKTEPQVAEPVIEDDDEMDVPPSLRERFRKKKKD